MNRTDEIQKYIESIDTRWGRFTRKQMEQIAEHFGGEVTSSGRYVKVDGEEYCIRLDSYGRRKVIRMDWRL